MGFDRFGVGRGFVAALGLCASLAQAAVAPTLTNTLTVVQQLPQENQQAFAQLALQHLVDSYRAELHRASGKAAGWRRGAGGYLGQLEALLAQLDAGTAVRFMRGAHGSFRLLVGSRQVMLQAPRDSAQGAFERGLVEDWAAMTEGANSKSRDLPQPLLADEVSSDSAKASPLATPAVAVPSALPASPIVEASPLATPAVAVPSPLAAPAVAVPSALPAEAPRAVRPTPEPLVRAPLPKPGTWHFSDDAGPTFASEDGLQCVYADSRHLKLKQAACTAVTQELRRVVVAAREVVARGGAIDWAALRLEPRGLGHPVHLGTGAGGKGFEIEAPHLRAAPQLLALLTPWLQARVQGQTLPGQFEVPEQLNYLEASLR